MIIAIFSIATLLACNTTTSPNSGTVMQHIRDCQIFEEHDLYKMMTLTGQEPLLSVKQLFYILNMNLLPHKPEFNQHWEGIIL